MHAMALYGHWKPYNDVERRGSKLESPCAGGSATVHWCINNVSIRYVIDKHFPTGEIYEL